MLTIPSTVAEIATIFDGAKITAIDKADLDGWPTGDEIAIAKEGELWVSKDICAYYEPLNGHIAKDFTSIDGTNKGAEKLRVYRNLDYAWYAWLYRALNNGRNKLSEDQWQRMSARFNIIWQITRRWWPADTINNIHKTPADYIPSNYLPPQADKGTAARFKARVNK